MFSPGLCKIYLGLLASNEVTVTEYFLGNLQVSFHIFHYDGTLGNQDGSVISNKTKFLVPQEIVSASFPLLVVEAGSLWRCCPVG